MALKLHIDSRKYCTKPKNDCTYFIIGTSYSFKFHTIDSLMHVPSSMISKPRNIVLLGKKLNF